MAMQTLSLTGSLPGRNEIDPSSGCSIRACKSRAGTILAGRYRVYKKIDFGIFKAHDLSLDQTVIIRGPFLSTAGQGDIWRKKAQRLALVRNSSFLNVLEVVSGNSGDFLVCEHPRGKSVAELLRERLRFDVEDVLTLMISLARALDLAAPFTCSPSLISARYLFTESNHWTATNPEARALSELTRLCVRLDVSALLTPGRNIGLPCFVSKAQRRGFKSVAVRQAALLTYELMGGDPKVGVEVKRRFRPIDDLSKSSNSLLYDGLLGAPRFKTSESFIQKLEVARRSGSRKVKTWSFSALQTREPSVSNCDTDKVLRGFNRQTKCLVAGVLGAVTFIAVAFAVMVPERQLKVVDLTNAASPSEPGSLFNAAFPMLFGKEEMNAKSIINGHFPVREPRVNPGLAEFSAAENLEPIEPVAAQTPNPVHVLDSRINQLHEQPNGSKWSPEPRDSARAVRILIPQKRHKPSDRLNVKMRLLALWHQSLARNSSRGWTLFSAKGEENKVSYAAHAGH